MRIEIVRSDTSECLINEGSCSNFSLRKELSRLPERRLVGRIHFGYTRSPLAFQLREDIPLVIRVEKE